ncbi:MAG: hypothetical protein E7464_06015 [Ruminococcaceae bacterium]|nr:hypothetical protein [Oscillospiraceae bacterium]
MNDIRIIKIGQEAIFELVYETLIDQTEELFRVIDVCHVQSAFGMNDETGRFWFAVHDDRLIYDEERQAYICGSAYQYGHLPLPDPEDFWVESSEDPWRYRSIDLNGGVPRRAGKVKRLGTELRMIQLTPDKMAELVNRTIYKNRKLYFGLRSTKNTEFQSLWNPQTGEYACAIFPRGKNPSDLEGILRSHPITTESMFQRGRYSVIKL